MDEKDQERWDALKARSYGDLNEKGMAELEELENKREADMQAVVSRIKQKWERIASGIEALTGSYEEPILSSHGTGCWIEFGPYGIHGRVAADIYGPGSHMEARAQINGYQGNDPKKIAENAAAAQRIATYHQVAHEIIEAAGFLESQQ